MKRAWGAAAAFTAALVLVPVAGCSSSSPKSTKSTTTSSVPFADGTGKPGGTVSTTTTVNLKKKFGFTGKGSKPFCDAQAKLSEQQAPAASTPAGVKGQLDLVLGAFPKLESVAPAEILPDLKSLQSIFQEMYAQYQKYGFDINNATIQAEASQYAARARAASTRVSAYASLYCPSEPPSTSSGGSTATTTPGSPAGSTP